MDVVRDFWFGAEPSPSPEFWSILSLPVGEEGGEDVVRELFRPGFHHRVCEAGHTANCCVAGGSEAVVVLCARGWSLDDVGHV